MAAGSPTSHDISIASDMELERVYSLLSSDSRFSDYHKTGFAAGKKAGFQDHRGNSYSDEEGRYKYGYDSGGGYLSSGYGGQRSSDLKERDAGSSSSSGIEDPYSHRSRSGSAASMHPETAEAGRERGEAAGHSSSISLDSGVGGAGQVVEDGTRHHRGPQDLPIPHLSKGLGSLILSDHPDRGYDYPTMFDMDR